MEELVRRAELSEFVGMDGRPHVIHVAGTNGKGSVTAYLQSMLLATGYRTGGFFSPFVYDIRERIQYQTRPISIADFTKHVNRLMPIAEQLTESEFGAVTEFEFKTAMGLDFWKEKRAEWVALEVGLGGRLDATNVVTPACSVIVSIGLDHTQILGDTLESIAAEKAGILKHGVPAVVGKLPNEALQVVEGKANQLSCELWRLGKEIVIEGSSSEFSVCTPSRTHGNLRSPLPGKHQIANVAVAVAAMDASGATRESSMLAAGLGNVALPGRFERRLVNGVEVILDGAHNAESIQALVETLQSEYPSEKFLTVFGMVEGHNPSPVARLLESVSDEVLISPIDFRRTRDARELASHFSIATTVTANSKEAIRVALSNAKGRKILVTGSFYLVGEVGRLLRDECGDSSLCSE